MKNYIESDLKSRYWFTYSTPKYGNCFTFNTLDNAANDDDVPRQATLTGRDNGKSHLKIWHKCTLAVTKYLFQILVTF
jgi:hypothetical protein